MKPRRQLLLPVEVAPRELKAKVLLAMEAAAAGWRVYVGEPTAVQAMAEDIGPSVYLEKNINAKRAPLLDKLAQQGHTLLAWDEEGLAVLDYDWYVTKNIKPDMLRRVAAFLCWGEAERAAIATRYPEESDRLQVTGNPRGDLLRPEWRNLLDVDAAGYRSRHGDYILFVSSFSRVNRFMGGTREDFVRTIQSSFGLADEKLAFLRGSLAHVEQIFEGFKSIIPPLARAFPERTIVIRPHPSENHDVWNDIASKHANVHVTFEGEATGWIAGAAAVLHNGCTTAVEAFAMGRLPICYRPVVSEEFDVELPNALSLTADSKANLIALLAEELGRSRTADQQRSEYLQRKVRLEHSLANCGPEPAANKVLDVINRFDLPEIDGQLNIDGALSCVAGERRRMDRIRLMSSARAAAAALIRGKRPIGSSSAYEQQKQTGFGNGVVEAYVQRLTAARPQFGGIAVRQLADRLLAIEIA